MLRCRTLLAIIMANLMLLNQSVEIAAFEYPQQSSMSGDPLQQGANVPSPNMDDNYWEQYDAFNPSSLDYDEFDWTFLKKVAFSTQGNTLISPLSVKLTLGILKEAATGVTAGEIEKVLGLPSVRNDARAKFSSIIGSLQTKSDKYVLDLGSRICLGNQIVARQKFSAIAEQFYNTEIKSTDFEHPKIATNDINKWASNITHNKIKKLVSEEDVSGVVMMVLNAIYFKGSWRKQFPVNQTTPSQFTYENFQQASVPFMNLEETFFFHKSDALDATLLRLPYQGLKFAMYIILPNTGTGVNDVIAHMDSFQLRRDILLMRERSVRLSLPRFRFEQLVQLKAVLRDMGIRQAFDAEASFPGISRGQSMDSRLRVSSIRQKAGIEVNEEGSEAYATTDVSLVNKSGDSEVEVIDFNVNRPFVFFIEDETTRHVLFAGKVMDPLTAGTSLEEPPAQTKN